MFQVLYLLFNALWGHNLNQISQMIPWLQISIQLSGKKKEKGFCALVSETLFTPFFPSKKAQEGLQKRYEDTYIKHSSVSS